MDKIRKYGLIGYPLTYSFSPSYFAVKFEEKGIIDAEYFSYPLERIEGIKGLIDSGILGFNVTIPYKEQIIPYLDELSDAARTVGAVNTVQVVDGKLIGYNTDVYGLENSLYRLLDRAYVDKALILGTGGASKACQYVLDQMGIEYKLVSRNSKYLTYDQLDTEILVDHKLIINTTPLGTSPNVDTCPDIPYKSFGASHFAFDLVYNPEKSLFLTRAEKRGAAIMNGLSMLHDQADESWKIWNRIL